MAPHPALHGLVALTAMVFLYCQARILHASKGIPAWRVAMMPSMLMLAGIYEGVGALAMLFAWMPAAMPPTFLLPLAGLLLAVASAAVWRAYLGGAAESGIGPLARADLAAATPAIHVVAHGVPFLCFAGFMIWPLGPDWLLGVAGAFAVAGGVVWKWVVITRACHEQGFALARWPQRGSGAFAAPASVETP